MRPSHLARIACVAAIAGLLGEIGCSKVGSPGSDTGGNATGAASGESIGLLDLDGKPFDFWKPGFAQVRVAIFTRSDCPISNRFAPEVREAYEAFHPRGVDFYLIYVDPNEQPDAIREHLKEYGYPCEALRDPEHTLVAFTGATVTPEAVVFDAHRNIAYRGRINDLYTELGKARSEPTKHDLTEAIEATLAGLPVAEPVTEAIGCYIGDLK